MTNENSFINSENNYNNLMESLYVESVPDLKEKIVKGGKTSIEDCLTEDEVEW